MARLYYNLQLVIGGTTQNLCRIRPTWEGNEPGRVSYEPPPANRAGRVPQDLAHDCQDHYYGCRSHSPRAPSPTDEYEFYSNERGVEIRY